MPQYDRARGEKTTQYVPSAPPVYDDTALLMDWLRREFFAVALGQSSIWDMPILIEEPSRPRMGMIRFADGVNWNPGSGQGPYFYYYNSDIDKGWKAMFT